MIDQLWKANLGIAQMRYKKGVTMSEENSRNVVREVRRVRKRSVHLAVQVSEARHSCLALLRDAQDAGEAELSKRLSDVWNSFGESVSFLFDAWAQLAAIERELP